MTYIRHKDALFTKNKNNILSLKQELNKLYESLQNEKKLIHNHNCLLVDEYENVNDWIKSIKKVNGNFNLRKKIYFNAIKTASKNTWRIRIKKIIKIYKKFYS